MENTNFLIKDCEYALILGVGAIGSALAREINRVNPSCRIFATKRVFSPTPENLPESARVLELGIEEGFTHDCLNCPGVGPLDRAEGTLFDEIPRGKGVLQPATSAWTRTRP